MDEMQGKQDKQQGRREHLILTVVVPIALCYLVFHLTGIGCPLRFLTGISCAGCGMTRAWHAVVRMNFPQAFAYHPLFFLPPLVLILYLVRRKCPILKNRVFQLTIVVLVFTIYLFRLLNPNDGIVVFDPPSGVLHRMIRKVI